MNFTQNVASPKQLLIVGLILLFSSCHSGGGKTTVSTIFGGGFVDADAFKTSIQKQLPSVNVPDSALRQLLLADSDGMQNAGYAYKLNGYRPLWIDESGIKPFTSSMLDQLRSLNDDGLDTARYNISKLEGYVTQLQSKTAPPLDSLVVWDKTLTATWLKASRDLLMGVVNIKKGDSLWFAANDTIFNGAALLCTTIKDHNELPSLDTFRSNAKLYGQMKAALKQWKVLKSDQDYIAAKNKLELGQKDSSLSFIIAKELPDVSVASSDSFNTVQQWLRTYQYYHQLGQSGKLDSGTLASLRQMPEVYIATLKLNLDRLRALPRNVEGEHVWVTIPLMEVGYFRGDEEAFHSRVVVGKLARQTPSLWANMSNVVFNPPWGVPPTILKNDIGPGVGRAGGSYLRRKGLRAFNAQGKDVTYSVNGSNYKKYSYRQPPGAGNSLGEVKFNLPNRWNIYLHDTPHRDNFSHSYRALSSGCVRVQNPKLLAEIILNNDRFTADKIDTIISTRKTKSEKLDRILPVYIIYATVAEDSSGKQLRYLKDIYKRDEKMLSSY